MLRTDIVGPVLIPLGLAAMLAALGCSALRYPTAPSMPAELPPQAEANTAASAELGAAEEPTGDGLPMDPSMVPDGTPKPRPSDLGAPPETESPSGPPRPPVLVGIPFGVPEDDLPEAEDAAPGDWSELTREARELVRRGRLDEAYERLEQARQLVADRPPTDAGRRTIFGLRARHALDLARLGRDDDAEALAEELFEAARREPPLVGPALVDLAFEMAVRRERASEESGSAESALPLLRLALDAAEAGSPSQRRLSVAFEIADRAGDAGDHTLARRGIDRAVLDAQVVAPNDRLQLGSLKVYKARIARIQGDLVTAEASARSAGRIFKDAGADDRNRLVADSTLAHVLADRGEIEAARELATAGRARLDEKPPLPDYVHRLVIGTLARVERIAGNRDAARARYREALAIPPVPGFELDADLRDELSAERDELARDDATGARPGADAPAP